MQIPVALTRVGDAASLTLSYQGCTEGLCYPPTDKRIAVEALAAPARAEAAASLQGTDGPGSQQDRLAAALGSQGFWISVAAFFALGLGLAFTPCVFPMYPILTGIIAGAGHRLSTRRAFLLSFVYVQGWRSPIPCSGSSSPRRACNSRRPCSTPMCSSASR